MRARRGGRGGGPHGEFARACSGAGRPGARDDTGELTRTQLGNAGHAAHEQEHEGHAEYADQLHSPFADTPTPTRTPRPTRASGGSGSAAYAALPSELPPRYEPRGTPLEVLRTKDLLFNHSK